MSAPDRWEVYSKIGKIVEGTLFIPFKVPLKHSVLESLPKGVDNKWNVEDLIEAIPSPGLGLVIDLTFTRKYYEPHQFTSKEIKHKKIMTKGREIPNSAIVEQFCTAVDEELAKEDRKLIGVHCTHGLNRTGYLICRYMIQKLGVDPEVAIAAFDEARGHKQERINYIQDLKTKGWEDSQDKLKSANKKGNANTNSEDAVESKKAVNEIGNKKRKLNEDDDLQTPKKVKVDQIVSSNVNGEGKKKKKKRKKKKKGNSNTNSEHAVKSQEAVNEIGNKKRKLNEDDVQTPKKVKVDQTLSSNVNGEGKKKMKIKKKGNANTNSEHAIKSKEDVNEIGNKKRKLKSKKGKFRKMEKEKKKLSATK